MANWCNNTVTFLGNDADIEKVVDAFRLIAAMSYGEGQQIAKDGGVSGYMFEIYAGGEEDVSQNYVNFQTKWAPVDAQIVKVANLFNVEFEYEYEELGCGVYGMYVYKNKELIDFYLTDDEIDLVIPKNEDWDSWSYNGEEYECREEALELVLKKKMNE